MKTIRDHGDHVKPPIPDYQFKVDGVWWDDSIQVINGRDSLNMALITLDAVEISKDHKIHKKKVKKAITLLIEPEVLGEYSLILMRMYRAFENRLKEMDGEK